MGSRTLSTRQASSEKFLESTTRSFEDLAMAGKELFSNIYVPETNSPPSGQTTQSGMSDGAQNNNNNNNRGPSWSKEQDEELRQAVAKHGAKQWKLIAQQVSGNKTHIQCLQRWSKVLKPGLVKGAWSEEEDALLVCHVARVAKGNWVAVANHIPGRSAKQCRERWMLVLNPDIRKDAWTEEEDKELLRLHAIHGNAWAMIAKQLEGRTENSTKSRFKSLERKRERSWTQGEDMLILRARGEDKTWEQIAALLPNRTKHAVKMRWKDITSSSNVSNSSGGESSPLYVSPKPVPSAGGVATSKAPPPPVSLPRPALKTYGDSVQSWTTATMTKPPSSSSAAATAADDILLTTSDSFEKWLQEPKFDLLPLSGGSSGSLAGAGSGGDVRMAGSSFTSTNSNNSNNHMARPFSSSRTEDVTQLAHSTSLLSNSFGQQPSSFGQILDLDFANFEDFDRV